MTKVKCSNHCSKCGAHFGSLSAWEAHRRGKYRPGPDDRGRHCVAPEDAADKLGHDMFMPSTTHGLCDLHGLLKRGVTVWVLSRPDEYEPEPDEAPPPTPALVRRRGGGSQRRRRSGKWGRTLEDVR